MLRPRRESATPPKLILTLAGNAPVVTVTGPPNQTVAQVGRPSVAHATATGIATGSPSVPARGRAAA
jgi:hypothetical protein